MPLPETITATTSTAVLEAACKFLVDERLIERMPLAKLLGETLAEIVRIRERLGDVLGPHTGYKRVTICGSARFARAMREWTARLMVDQHSMVFTAPLIENLSEKKKHAIDLLWFAMIAASDEIFVVDVGGYVGRSTGEEIAYAKERGRRIRYLSDEEPGWTEAQCRYAPQMVDLAGAKAGEPAAPPVQRPYIPVP